MSDGDSEAGAAVGRIANPIYQRFYRPIRLHLRQRRVDRAQQLRTVPPYGYGVGLLDDRLFHDDQFTFRLNRRQRRDVIHQSGVGLPGRDQRQRLGRRLAGYDSEVG